MISTVTAVPSASTSSAKRALSAADIPAVGSSSSSSLGEVARARATSSWRRSPCDRAAAGTPARPASLTSAPARLRSTSRYTATARASPATITARR
jgi:hypothetical protein